MKFRTFLAVAGFCFFAMGCKSKVAMDYNKMIVQNQKNMGASMYESEPKLKNHFATFEYDSIVSVSNRMEAKIDSIIRRIEKEPAPKADQGQDFKKVVLRYFDYFKTVYASYKNYGLQTTPEGRQSAAKDMTMILTHEDKVIADMLEAQRVFAKDNNFKIRDPKNNSWAAK